MGQEFTFMESEKTLTEIISTRRTIHTFKSTLPSQELLYKSIEMARWAPNHKLTEPWHFYILGPDTTSAVAHANADLVRKKLGDATAEKKLCRWLSMPSTIVVTSKKSEDVLRNREDYAATCCAIQNMMLFLWSEGVGSKWSTSALTRDPVLTKILHIDDTQEQVVGIIWCGYPEDIPEQQRKSVQGITTEMP